MDLQLVYESTRRAANRMGSWQLKRAARRARRALAADPHQPRLQVRAVAFEHELTARGRHGREPRPEARYHRLA